MKMNITSVRFTREVIMALALGTILSYVLHLVLLPLLGKHVSMPYTFTCGLIYAGILLAITYFATKQAAHMQRAIAHEALMQEIEVAERVQQLQRACRVSGTTVAELIQFQEELQQSRAK
jgi:hypothetical protein